MLRLSAGICEFLIFVTAILSLHLRTTDCRQTRNFYATFAPHLEDLEQFEQKIAKNLTQALFDSKWLTIGSEIRDLVHTYLIGFYRSTGSQNIQGIFHTKQTSASKSPICAYRLVRRAHLILKNLITHKHFLLKFGELRREIIHFFWTNGWPIFLDNQIAAEKVLTIHHVYNLEAEKLAQGLIMKVQSNCSLSSIHCYEIGNIAFQSGQFTVAFEWLELAKQRAVVDKKASLAFIEFSIWSAIDEHNWNYLKKRHVLDSTFYNRQIRYIAGDSKRAQKIRDIQYNELKGKRGRRSLHVKNANFWGLCSGENFQTGREKATLFCWFEFKLHASLTIGPLKMEFLARNPDVVQAYEIAKDIELETILAECRTKMIDSGLQMSGSKCQNQKYSPRKIRSIVSSCFDEAGFAIPRKIKQLFGFVDISGEVQVDSYSFGGHCFPHQHLMAINSRKTGGDQVGTAVFHINHVEEGGEIAFPTLGLATKPVKGSLVFWPNIYPDGRSDWSTNSGSCPILMGQKWVATKLIRLKDRFFGQKCGLNPNERFRIPVNGEYLPVPNIVLDTVEETPLPKYPFENPEMLAKYSFVSPRGLKALVQFEWSLYPRIKNIYNKYRNKTKGTFREEFDKKSMDVRKYLEEFERFTIKLLGGLGPISNKDTKMVEKVALNLLAAYRTVTRFMDYMQTWFRQRKKYTDNPLMARITSYLENVYKLTDGPTQADLEAAMFGVWYTQFTQNLEMKDVRVLKRFPTMLPEIIRKILLVVNGIVAGIDTRVNLSARDCLNFGNHWASFSLAEQTLMWTEHAFHLVNNTSDGSVTYEEAYDALDTRQLDYECKLERNKPICRGYARLKHVWNKLNLDVSDYKLHTMCTGKNYQTDNERSKLFCWYERQIHPSYNIGPIKAEWLSLHPKTEIVHFYDVLSNRLIQSLTNFAYEHVVRDGELDEKGQLIAEPFQRQIVFAFADPETIEGSMYVSKLAERMTGLKVVNKTGGPPLRLSGYAPGGHRSKHADGRDQAATFMVYLNDVEKGGETPFIASGVSAVPRKGSAIFWYNTFTDGSADNATKHGSCPIILGEKWVAVRWILYNWQDHLKCDLKTDTPYTILVNGKPMY